MLAQALLNLCPNIKFTIIGDDYNSIVTDSNDLPSLSELNQEVSRMKALKVNSIEVNKIKLELEEIDKKSIRALRENNQDLINQYEHEAENLRIQLRALE
ncbi:hypothetical protein CRV02_08380 [Arcobacter sp. CECT 8989]|uniref:hypothetical protein n=1 Tax=Arcobacter sp. CECT 8989 TaxID=2044509 RepID=UPI00100A5D19|nr:hypothetical protein [Arcobacter sp. CECT 8989]RXK01516.1 hypothetical protein CRV02_08380 [Arcobacter sp. CECT 8989]